MGGDGGSIPGRADVVRVKGYGFKRNLGGMGYDPNTLIHVGDGRLGEDERRRLRFTRCFLSEELLDPPIVADKLGRLYNKEALLMALMEGKLPEQISNCVKRLKDIQQIVPQPKRPPTPFPIWDAKEKRLQCPLSGTPCLGTSDFLLSWKCGCIYSKKAAHELSLDNKLFCPVCSRKVTTKDPPTIELIPPQTHRSPLSDLQSVPQKRHYSDKKPKALPPCCTNAIQTAFKTKAEGEATTFPANKETGGIAIKDCRDDGPGDPLGDGSDELSCNRRKSPEASCDRGERSCDIAQRTCCGESAPEESCCGHGEMCCGKGTSERQSSKSGKHSMDEENESVKRRRMAITRLGIVG